MKYKCVEPFSIPLCDDDGGITEEYKDVEKGSLWELDDSTSIIGGEHHLDNSETLEWLEIDNESLKKYFAPVKDGDKA